MPITILCRNYLVAGVLFCGCAGTSVTANKVRHAVPVAKVHYDTLREGNEVVKLLIRNGIHAQPEREATLAFRIFVPEDRSHEALSILETNRMVLEGRVQLIRAMDSH
jgi:hypothetical protein